MAFEVLEPNLAIGLESKAIRLIATLNYLITLPAPITESVMRLDLEAGQPVTAGRPTAFTDAGWLDFVAQLSRLTLDESALTVAERTLMNTLRTIVVPTPQSFCCGVAPITDGLTSVAAFLQVGFPNFRREFELKILGAADCALESVVVTLVPIGPAPAVTSANPFNLFFKECRDDSKYLSNVVVEFAGDPAGESYEITNLDFLDADGASIVNFAPSYDWVIP